ncbi:MAG: nitroreductase family protein [Duncaniella sp.]|nr:nitroreductase family protein [Duncaniella sp.]
MTHLDSYPQFYSLSEDRFSCRSYKTTEIEPSLVLSVLDAARLAPSACNRQPWIFAVADTPQLHEAVAASYPREWFAAAPVYIVACGLHSEAWHRPADGKDHTDVDVAIAVEHLCLAAASLGLGSCWVCNFDVDAVAEAFNMPEGVEPIALIPLGYPADGTTPSPKNRKSLTEIVRWGKF